MNLSELKEFLKISNKGKLSWIGDFESLKIFLNIKGQWSSLGGEAKALENDQLIIRWCGRKQSLTINGSSSETVRGKLVKLVNKMADNAADSALVSSKEDEAYQNQKLVKVTIPVFMHKFLKSNNNERENNSGKQPMEGKASNHKRSTVRFSEHTQNRFRPSP